MGKRERTPMSGAQCWRRTAALAILAAASTGSGMAQSVPLTLTPAPAAVPTVPEVAPALPPAAEGAPAAGEPEVACSCGDRWGLARWRWHRAHCKQKLQEHFFGYLNEFNEWPLGYSLYAHGRTQAANAEAARMAFYHYDFVEGTSQLNVRGRDKLAKLGTLLPTTFSPIVVERTPTERGLDEARRLALVDELARGPFAVPAERIVIGPPIPYGMSGVEAVAIYGNQLQHIAAGGFLAGGGGVASFTGGPGTFSGAGLSGAAVTAVPR